MTNNSQHRIQVIIKI